MRITRCWLIARGVAGVEADRLVAGGYLARAFSPQSWGITNDLGRCPRLG